MSKQHLFRNTEKEYKAKSIPKTINKNNGG